MTLSQHIGNCPNVLNDQSLLHFPHLHYKAQEVPTVFEL